MKQLLATVSLVIVASAASANNFDHDASQSTFTNWLNGYVEGVIKASDLIIDQVNAVSDIAPDIDTPDIEGDADITTLSNYDAEVIGDGTVPEELAYWGTAVNKVAIPEGNGVGFDFAGNGIGNAYHEEGGILWLVDAHTAIENSIAKTHGDQLAIHEVNGEFSLIGAAEYNIQGNYIYGIEFVQGSQYTAETPSYAAARITQYDEDDNEWDIMSYHSKFKPWIEEALQNAGDTTIVVNQIHTEFEVDIDYNESTIASFTTTLSSSKLNSLLDMVSDVAEQAYNSGYDDGFQDGYKLGFEDGVNSVKDAVN